MKKNDTVKVDESTYSKLSDIDRVVIDLNLDVNKKYEVEDIFDNNSKKVIFLKNLTNVGFDFEWFKVV